MRILSITIDILFIIGAVSLLISEKYEAAFLCMIFIELKGINVFLREAKVKP